MLVVLEAGAQAIPAPATNQPRSLYLGTPVTHPEDLSGIWEAPNGHGGAVGIYLILMTTAPAEATTLVGTPQSWLHLEMAVYEHPKATLQLNENNGFSDDMQPFGGVHYDAGHLTLHYPQFDLDLVRTRSGGWRGRFHRKQFDARVTLKRPAPPKGSAQPWFIGTWRTGDAAHQTCLQIAEQAPGVFTGWSDTLLAWGSARFAPHLKRPEYSLESYGDLAKVQASENGLVSVELNAYTAMCCSHAFTARPTANGTIMQADWRSPHASVWTKMPGDSCIVPRFVAAGKVSLPAQTPAPASSPWP